MLALQSSLTKTATSAQKPQLLKTFAFSLPTSFASPSPALSSLAFHQNPSITVHAASSQTQAALLVSKMRNSPKPSNSSTSHPAKNKSQLSPQVSLLHPRPPPLPPN